MALPSGKVRDQLVYYEHEPKFCSTCKIFGHKTDACQGKTVPANHERAILPKNVAGKTGTQGSEHDQNIAGSSGQQAKDGQNVDCNSSQPTIEQNCSLETAKTRSHPNGQNVSESGQAESTSQNNAQ